MLMFKQFLSSNERKFTVDDNVKDTLYIYKNVQLNSFDLSYNRSDYEVTVRRVGNEIEIFCGSGEMLIYDARQLKEITDLNFLIRSDWDSSSGFTGRYGKVLSNYPYLENYIVKLVNFLIAYPNTSSSFFN